MSYNRFLTHREVVSRSKNYVHDLVIRPFSPSNLYEWKNVIFFNFMSRIFLTLILCLKPTGETVNFARNAAVSLYVLENTDNSKSPNSLVINDDPLCL